MMRGHLGSRVGSRLAPLFLATVLASSVGCSRMAVESSSEPDWSTTGLHKYSWRPLPGGALGDPRVDEEWVVKNIRQNVDTELAKKGYTKTDAEHADFEVGHWIAMRTGSSAGTQGSPGNWGTAYRPSGYWEARGRVPASHIEKGTIGVYIVDPVQQRNVWRGWARAAMNFKATREKRKARIKEAVRQILRSLPNAD